MAAAFEHQGRQTQGWVAGVDGCRVGWVVCFAYINKGEVAETRTYVVDHFRQVMESSLKPRVIAVDMPIGLPAKAKAGGRVCDKEARTALGKPRQTSVFSPPVRAVLDCDDYTQAQRVMKKSSLLRISLSKQTWNIVPKIREVDEAVRKVAGQKGAVRTVECHPELTFCEMAGTAMAERKGTADGQRARMTELRRAGFAVPKEALGLKRAGYVAADDIVDAHACAWTARRVLLGMSSTFPEDDVATDGCGLAMVIHA